MWQCPNECNELPTLYQAEAGLYWGCPECLHAGELLDPNADRA